MALSFTENFDKARRTEKQIKLIEAASYIELGVERAGAFSGRFMVPARQAERARLGELGTLEEAASLRREAGHGPANTPKEYPIFIGIEFEP